MDCMTYSPIGLHIGTLDISNFGACQHTCPVCTSVGLETRWEGVRRSL